MTTHAKLMAIVVKLAQDYEPFGKVIRFADKERNYPDCSMGCKHYAPLEGELGLSWGICSNQASHRCGLLTFEHQGCEHFQL